MSPLTAELAESITARSAALDRFDNRLIEQLLGVFDALISELEAELTLADLEDGTVSFRRARARVLLGQARKQVNEAYEAIGAQLELDLAEVVGDELTEAAGYINQALAPLGNLAPAVNTVALAPDTLKQIARNTVVNMGDTWGALALKDWLANQSDVTIAGMARQLNNSILRGEGTKQQVARLRKHVFEAERRTLEALARTGTQSVVSHARRRVYQRNRGVLQGVYQLTTSDDRTTEVCLAYANRAWYWDEQGNEIPYEHSMPYNGGIPRHPNCRSVDMPWLKSLKDMGVDPRRSSKGLRRLFDGGPPDTVTGNQILREVGEGGQAKIMSRYKAQQWRSGRMKIEDLIKPDGSVRNDSEIRALLKRRGV